MMKEETKQHEFSGLSEEKILGGFGIFGLSKTIFSEQCFKTPIVID